MPLFFTQKKVTKGTFFNLFKKENIEVFAANDPYPFDDYQSKSEKNFSQPTEQVKAFTDQSAALNQVKVKPTAQPVQIPKEKFNDMQYLEPVQPIEKIQTLLRREGIHSKYIEEWTRLLVKEWYKSGENMDLRELAKVLKKRLKDQISVTPSSVLLPEEKLIALAGPTGVGKTTTLAKLAAKAVLEEKQKVAFITLDTYRIAAIEQLKTYAGILNVPVEVVYTAEEFSKVLNKHQSMDKIFIDTAGRNYMNHRYVEELNQLLPKDEDLAVFLVMSATSKDEDMDNLLAHFNGINLKGLIFTKVDETATTGSLVNLLLKNPEPPLSYITTGQDVPDDLEKASLNKLADQLLRGVHHV